MTDSSGWSSPGTVASFAQSEPNPELMRFGYAERVRVPDGVLLDVGCGAARNLMPLAREGWRGIGLDFSEPMLMAAADRLDANRVKRGVRLARARMDCAPGLRPLDRPYRCPRHLEPRELVWGISPRRSRSCAGCSTRCWVVRVYVLAPHLAHRCDARRGRVVRVHPVLGSAAMLPDGVGTGGGDGRRRV